MIEPYAFPDRPASEADGLFKPLPDIMVGWPASQFANLITLCIDFLQRYDALEIGSKARLELVLDMEVTSSISFPARIEPRRTIVVLLTSAIAAVPATFYEAVDCCVRRSRRWRSNDMRYFLSLLVETKQPFPSYLAFLALSRIEAFEACEQDERTVALLVYLVPSDGSSVLSMLERLKRSGLLSLPVLENALRSLARSDPGQLPILFELFSDVICSDDDLDSLQFLLRDLADRAGGFTVLKAICLLDPYNFPTLFKAAFAGCTPLYTLKTHISGERLEAFTYIDFEGHILELSVLGRKPQDEDWLLRLRLATAHHPEIKVTDRYIVEQYDDIVIGMANALRVRLAEIA